MIQLRNGYAAFLEICVKSEQNRGNRLAELLAFEAPRDLLLMVPETERNTLPAMPGECQRVAQYRSDKTSLHYKLYALERASCTEKY
jgi:hypothetical protein